MIKRLCLIAVAIYACACIAGDASEDRLTVKGFFAGITEAEVRELNQAEKYCPNAIRMEFRDGIYGLKGSKIIGCNDFTIANQSAQVVIMRTGSVLMIFDSGSFGSILNAMTVKYGSGDCNDSTVRNGMGAEFTQSTCDWAIGGSFLRLQRFGSKVTQGSLMLSNTETLNRFQNSNSSKARSDAGDL